MKWHTLTSPQLDQIDRDTPVILNLAAVEQHGPHLPLNTDVAIGEHFLNAVEKRNDQSQLILPAVQVCCSEHHLGFAGTLSVPHSVLLEYVSSILDSVVKSGFRRILLFNSHGGNQAIAQVVVEQFGARNQDCLISLATWWSLAKAGLLDVTTLGSLATGHAGEFETSIMMAAGLVPEDLDVPPGMHRVTRFPWSEASLLQAPTASLFEIAEALSGGSGIVGQPEAATAEKGRKITELVATALEELIVGFRQLPAPT